MIYAMSVLFAGKYAGTDVNLTQNVPRDLLQIEVSATTRFQNPFKTKQKILYHARFRGNKSTSKRPFSSRSLIISSSDELSLFLRRKYFFFHGINWKWKSQ